jgi:phospholipid-binding lipoprotein MlaA
MHLPRNMGVNMGSKRMICFFGLLLFLFAVVHTAPGFASPEEGAVLGWQVNGTELSCQDSASSDPALVQNPLQVPAAPLFWEIAGPSDSTGPGPGPGLLLEAQVPVAPTPEENPTLSGPNASPEGKTAAPPKDETEFEEEEDATTARAAVPDPFEPVNRAFFQFNDKLYFWALKPVATVYKKILPEDLRVAIRNFFSNVATPVRFGNCLLQVDFKCAGNELFRFGLNSTFGLLGLFDQAKDKFDVAVDNRDFGQTLGRYGFPPLLYIEWPILGSSNVRDSLGFVGDTLMDPKFYLLNTTTSLSLRAGQTVNETSLRIGDYEALKKAAIDAYIAKRDAYNQYRANKIKKNK